MSTLLNSDRVDPALGFGTLTGDKAMQTVEGAGQNYFSEYFAMPDRVTEVFKAIKEIEAKLKQSSFSHMQRRQMLKAGVSPPAIFARFVREVYPIFVDCRSAARNSPSLAAYIDQLIAPNALAAARNPIADLVNIDDRDEIADDLCMLDMVAPEIVTALLELQIGKAERLFCSRLAVVTRDDERETLLNCRHLTQTMMHVKIAYRLRCEAMKSEGRAHAQFGWPVLDDLESLGTGGCLRLSTLLNRIERESTLVEHVCAISRDPTLTVAPHKCLLNYPVATAPIGAASVLPPSLRFLDALDIERRAHIQMAFWRLRHGTHLEAIVHETIGEITASLPRMRAAIAAHRRHHPNTIVANLGHATAGSQLYFAVQEAVAWTRDSKSEGGINATSPIATALKACTKKGSTRRDIPLPKLKPEDTNSVDELFVIFRIAFLQDNEALPLELRKIVDPKSGETIQVKTHEHAAMILGRRYTFTEQWNAWRRSMAAKMAKLPANRTKEQVLQARQIDLVAKRDAFKILKRRGGTKMPTRGAFDRRDALRTEILRGFLAT